MTLVRRGGLIASVVLALIGISAVIGGLGYGVTVEGGEIGPGFLPVLSGALVGGFAILDVIGRLRNRTDLPTQAELILDTMDTPPTTDTGSVLAPANSDAGAPSTSTQSIYSITADANAVDIVGRTQKQRNRMLAVVIGLTILTLLAVQLVGFLIAFVLLLFVIAVFVEKRKIVPAVAVALSAGAVTYAVFVLLLRVPLPQGLLGII
jgi:putative tricarboxylic transport membrane protein